MSKQKRRHMRMMKAEAPLSPRDRDTLLALEQLLRFIADQIGKLCRR